MIDDIERLKYWLEQGSISTVTTYGNSKKLQDMPYIVLTNTGTTENRKTISINVHYKIGSNKELEKYILEELPQLVSMEKDICGAPYFRSNGTWTGISVDTGDNTLLASVEYYSICIFPRSSNT